MRYFICMIVFLTSCTTYKRNFDCPPGPGINCTSVTTLEKMIVESPSGPDIFLGCVPKLIDVQTNPCCRCTNNEIPEAPFQRRIWIPFKDGKSSYLFFQETLPCAEL